MNTLVGASQIAAELEGLRERLRDGEAKCAAWRDNSALRLVDKPIEDLQPTRDRIHLLEIRLAKLQAGR